MWMESEERLIARWFWGNEGDAKDQRVKGKD